jgi:tRNA-guanine family transglycosylase
MNQLINSKTIKFGKHKLRIPVLFASYRLGDQPAAGLRFMPWDITETEALLINAYDFKRPKYQLALNNGWSPTTHLYFANKPIMIDSGAYYFRKYENMVVTPNDILEIELKSQADVGVVLDHPFPPDAMDKAKRIDTTIRNTEVMLKALATKHETMELMPVVHGHTSQAICGCLQRIRRLVETNGSGDLVRVGIGSLAPLAQYGNARLAVKIIHTVRTQLPETHIHCFSMGSALLMLLAFYCGANTMDSQSWILSAAFKSAQLPGYYIVRMARREYKTKKNFKESMSCFAERLKKLADEEEFFVKDWYTGEVLDLQSKTVRDQYVQSLVDIKSNENIHNRACHNLWVYNFEVRQTRQAIIENRFEQFVETRLANTRYKTAFEYAKSKKRKA